MCSSLTGLPLVEGGGLHELPTWRVAFAMYTGAARDGSSSLRTKWFPAYVTHKSKRLFQIGKLLPLCVLKVCRSHNAPPASRNRDADRCASQGTLQLGYVKHLLRWRNVSLSARHTPLRSVKLPVRAPPGSFFRMMAASVSGRHCMQHCNTLRLQYSESTLRAVVSPAGPYSVSGRRLLKDQSPALLSESSRESCR